jgi:arginine decarboxylase
MDGDQFKRMLMDRFSIQVNKTSRNTVLFLIHIGTTPPRSPTW